MIGSADVVLLSFIEFFAHNNVVVDSDVVIVVVEY